MNTSPDLFSASIVAICFFLAFSLLVAAVIVIVDLLLFLFQSRFSSQLNSPDFYQQIKDLMSDDSPYILSST